MTEEPQNRQVDLPAVLGPMAGAVPCSLEVAAVNDPAGNAYVIAIINTPLGRIAPWLPVDVCDNWAQVLADAARNARARSGLTIARQMPGPTQPLPPNLPGMPPNGSLR